MKKASFFLHDTPSRMCSGNGALLIIVLASCAFLLWAFIWPRISFPGENEEERNARLAQVPDLLPYFPLVRTDGQGLLLGETPDSSIVRVLVTKPLPKSARDTSGRIHLSESPLHVVIPNRTGDFQALLKSGSYSLVFEHTNGELSCATTRGWVSLCALSIKSGGVTSVDLN